jgi:hypothetical protein
MELTPMGHGIGKMANRFGLLRSRESGNDMDSK